jgi:hypothetical protein
MLPFHLKILEYLLNPHCLFSAPPMLAWGTQHQVIPVTLTKVNFLIDPDSPVTTLVNFSIS